MDGIEKYLEEHGADLAIGLILGIGIAIAILMVAAISDRRPPDRKDE